MSAGGARRDDESVGDRGRRIGVEGEERVDSVSDRGDIVALKEELGHDCGEDRERLGLCVHRPRRRGRTRTRVVGVAERFSHDNGMRDPFCGKAQFVKDVVEHVLLQGGSASESESVNITVPRKLLLRGLPIPHANTHHLIKVGDNVPLERTFNVAPARGIDVGLTPREEDVAIRLAVAVLCSQVLRHNPRSILCRPAGAESRGPIVENDGR